MTIERIIAAIGIYMSAYIVVGTVIYSVHELWQQNQWKKRHDAQYRR
jgi:hypothetical protein